jgi:hypothetical protein
MDQSTKPITPKDPAVGHGNTDSRSDQGLNPSADAVPVQRRGRRIAMSKPASVNDNWM